MASLVEARALAFSYDGHAVLRRVEFTVAENEVVGLVGPNGVGKTTLLSLLLGLLRPERGRVSLCGEPVAGLSRRALARCAALVPQDARLDVAFTVREIVAMGRNPHLGRFRPEGPHDAEAVRQALIQTETEALAERAADTLSGGERQRVLVARALAQETPVVLLDEPTANLDLAHQLETLELVRRIAREGRCAVAALHDLSLASRYCDRIVVLHDGVVAADGPPRAVLTEANLARYFRVQARLHDVEGQPGLTVVPLRPVSSRSAPPADSRDDPPES